MKTPREVILQRHQSAETKLAALRPEQLAALAKPADDADRVPGFGSMLKTFWRESIWPWRRVWAGLGAVWLAIVGVNFSTNSPASTARIEMTKKSEAQVQTVLLEQRKLLAQLLGPVAPADAVPSKQPGPRSEQRREIFIA